MATHLFVGGSHDGEWIESDMRANHMELAERQPLPRLLNLEAVPITARTSIKEVYIRRKLHWEGADRFLWGEKSLSDADIVNRLLRNYRP